MHHINPGDLADVVASVAAETEDYITRLAADIRRNRSNLTNTSEAAGRVPGNDRLMRQK